MMQRFFPKISSLLFVSLVSAFSLHSQTLPTSSMRSAGDSMSALLRSPWKSDIVATVFWVGEKPTKKNPTPNNASSWDCSWQSNFGGFDDPQPSKRAADFRPASFVPKQNPFYVALPYNDCVDHQTTKTEAEKVIPWFKSTFVRQGKSVCQNRWVAIRYGDRTCYAQWSDCGPFSTTDASYVFGSARPTNQKNNGAGIDLAPAVRDYLGFSSGQKCDWRFVESSEVPDGPWKSYGSNNPYSQTYVSSPSNGATPTVASNSSSKSAPSTYSGDERLEELRRMRDKWFQSSGGGWSH